MNVKMQLEIYCDTVNMENIISEIEKIKGVEEVEFENAYPR